MDFLRTNKGYIVNSEQKVIVLKGCCIGGWMNLEDFINGYPGTENGIRTAIGATLGKEMAQVFYNRMRDCFFTEKDAAFLARTGANCVRIPLNYRLFESDSAPFAYHEAAFQELEHAVRLCESYGLYVILDMHAAAGWQNCHWHCDNERGVSLLWKHPHFQDRLIALWKEIARRFKDNTAVAGYELLNEPSTGNPNGEHGFDFYSNYQSDWESINSLYKRLVESIREIDPRHIIILEGDNYGRAFQGLDAPFAENLVYSSHNYTAPGYGPGAYPGYYESERGQVYWDINKHRQVFLQHEGTQFAQKHQVPLLVGEFGSQYHGSAEELPYRYRSMSDQLSVYNEFGASWTAWTYKDMGVMGWVTLRPGSEYSRIVEPIQQMKRVLGAENFVAQYWDSPGREKSRELADLILRESGNKDLRYDDNAYTFNYAALTGYAAAMLQPAYAYRFMGMSQQDIQRIMDCFLFENCEINLELCKVLERHMKN